MGHLYVPKRFPSEKLMERLIDDSVVLPDVESSGESVVR
jgi:hypothetical protein